MDGKEDAAGGHRKSETTADGLAMDDHLGAWEDIHGLPEFPIFSFATEPLDFLLSPLVSDPLGLSTSALSFPPSELSLRSEAAAEAASHGSSVTASASRPLPFSLVSSGTSVSRFSASSVVSQPATAVSGVSRSASKSSSSSGVPLTATAVRPPSPLEHFEFPPSRLELPSATFVPAMPPLHVMPNKDGLASVDFEEAARQGLRVAELRSAQDKTQTKKRGKKALGIAERFSRPLGITGWTALGKFKHVKASPLHLWVKRDRYPELVGEGSFIRAVPTLKALLPIKPSTSLPHSLTYLECGHVDPSLPLDRCRVLLPNLSSWQSHQFLCHALGYLCVGCNNWLETEPALNAHALECEQQKGE